MLYCNNTWYIFFRLIQVLMFIHFYSASFRVFSRGRGQNDDNRNEGWANIFSTPMFILAHTYIAYNICHFQGGGGLPLCPPLPERNPDFYSASLIFKLPYIRMSTSTVCSMYLCIPEGQHAPQGGGVGTLVVLTCLMCVYSMIHRSCALAWRSSTSSLKC